MSIAFLRFVEVDWHRLRALPTSLIAQDIVRKGEGEKKEGGERRGGAEDVVKVVLRRGW